jgi:Ca2+-transporting ATPase
MSLQPAGVPSIHISTELASPSSDPVSPSHNHVQSGLLSPTRHNPSSPTASDLSDAGSIPPSPTLSSHSTNFATTLNLRDNKPDEKSGLASLGLLEPAGITTQRRPSNATSMSDTDGETFGSVTAAT